MSACCQSHCLIYSGGRAVVIPFFPAICAAAETARPRSISANGNPLAHTLASAARLSDLAAELQEGLSMPGASGTEAREGIVFCAFQAQPTLKLCPSQQPPEGDRQGTTFILCIQEKHLAFVTIPASSAGFPRDGQTCRPLMKTAMVFHIHT
jgi:hypothetical protein